MQCASCLCSDVREVTVDSRSFFECTFCGNLVPAEKRGSGAFADELEGLRRKLREATEIIDALDMEISRREKNGCA